MASPSSHNLSLSAHEARAQIAQLHQQLDRIRTRSAELHQVLRDQGVGPRLPALVGPDGFPIPDVDHLVVATARGELARLTNDQQRIQDRVQVLLATALAPGSPGPSTSNGPTLPAPPSPNGNGTTNGSIPPDDPAPPAPFARINSVAPSSPAAAAGLQAGDEVVSVLGSSVTGERVRVTVETHGTPLSSLPPLVHDGRPIVFVVRRRGSGTTSCMLTPRAGWGGRGLLGCHIVPVE